MAVDFSLRILVDSAVSADEKARIVRELLSIVNNNTKTIAYATTHSGVSDTSNVVATVTA